MREDDLSMRRLLAGVTAGMLLSMAAVTAFFYFLTSEAVVIAAGVFFAACCLCWLLLLTHLYGRKLSMFTSGLCRTLDEMMSGNFSGMAASGHSETISSRIHHQLSRLYQAMRENRRRVEQEQRELQELVSDISHQVKTPVSNIKMVTETLLDRQMSAGERREFLTGIRSQAEKLDFLMQALVKMSRLETGVIQMEKKNIRIYETVAQAVSGIVYAAEKKNITVSVDCPEDLAVIHDRRWTAEALFNLLDNAVKYTPAGGCICVTAEPGEMYAEIRVTDTGKGIPESRQAAIFRRFYREEEVHDVPGIGLGLCLAREIVTRQGGYIRVRSEEGKGASFSILLPVRTFL